MSRAHSIEIFSADCPLCRHVTEELEIGRCKGCSQTVYDVNSMTDDVRKKMRDYGVTSVPSVVVDGVIKVVGVPEFAWVCSDELYEKLRREYPLGK